MIVGGMGSKSLLVGCNFRLAFAGRFFWRDRAAIMLGRPTIFSQELADEICERLADGESLKAICAAPDMPNRSTVFRWLASNKDFCDTYARAREAQADVLADEILVIADDGSNDTYETDDGPRVNQDVIARSRLRVDARKWIAAKLKPKVYAERNTTAVEGPDGGPVQLSMTVEFVSAKGAVS